jgi:hypothetical protein
VDEGEHLERERDVLVLAASDMRQVQDAADALQHGEMNANARRVLWTGLVTTYARPYLKRNTRGFVTGRLAKPRLPELHPLHESLLMLRKKLAAHTDDNELRSVLVVAEELSGSGRYAEAWKPYDDDALSDIAWLAADQEYRFKKRLDEIGEQLKLLDG